VGIDQITGADYEDSLVPLTETRQSRVSPAGTNLHARLHAAGGDE